jgi:hypothetical protein
MAEPPPDAHRRSPAAGRAAPGDRDRDGKGDGDYAPSALPSTAARILAFASILVGGLCGGLIGWAFIDLQCEGDCAVQSGGAGLFGAVVGAGGVAVVAVLALRAMGEWRTIQHRRPGSPDTD